ncbi:MAG: hypothetical protein HC901_01070 [Bdellovibrionaceae bacterium]|nr:hypothetical protein [Pseudobdellovibrionaceae bacterium]
MKYFSASTGNRTMLDLGEVRDLAVIRVNGQEVGALWRSPFQIDVSAALKSGKNELEIRVINTWVNRLIGDKKVPEQERICRIVPADPPWYDADSELLPSGLLGPVKIGIPEP